MAEEYIEEEKMLSLNEIGLEKVGIKSLAEFLSHRKKTHLCLSGNGMDNNDLKCVADVLKNTQITNLVLENNKIGCDGLKYLSGVLKDTQLTCLNLKNNNIRNDGFIYLAEMLNDTKIRQLDLEANEINLEGDNLRLTGAIKLTQITHLNLRNNKMRCRGLIHLANMLKDSRISDLNLQNNDLRDDGVKYLADSLKDTPLNRLHLEDNKIGFEAAGYLNQHLSAVKSLYFYIYDTENGIQLISQSGFSSGVSMTLYSYKIGMVGSNYVNKHFREKGIYTLEVSFYCHQCTEDDICYLSQAFSNMKIKSLFLSPNHFTQPRDVDCLVKIFEKSHIGYLPIRKYIGSDIQYLAQFLKRVKVLNLSMRYNHLTDDSIKTLVPVLKNNDIMELDLTGNYITSKGAKYLSEILQDSKIVSINLCNCDIGIEGAKNLANGLPHSQVTDIHLHNNGIEYAGYQALIDVVDDTNISWVNLHRNNIEAGLNGKKLWPYSIPRNTTTIAHKIEVAFRNLVSLNSDSEELQFVVPKKENCCYPPLDIHQYAFLIGTLKNNPNSKVHIIYKNYTEGTSNYDFDAIQKLDNFIKNITNKFISFFESKLPDLLVRFSNDDYVYLVKQFEEFKLHDIVQHLLLHRVLFYVDENQEILHPYIYKLLNQYNLPLYNSELEPNKKTEIMSYYENHKEIDESQEIIDMLKSIVL